MNVSAQHFQIEYLPNGSIGNSDCKNFYAYVDVHGMQDIDIGPNQHNIVPANVTRGDEGANVVPMWTLVAKHSDTCVQCEGQRRTEAKRARALDIKG